VAQRLLTSLTNYFLRKDLKKTPSHTLHVGWLTHHDQALDEVVVSIFRNPRSYTGEDVVELSCHGSPYNPATGDGCLPAVGCKELPGRVNLPNVHF
jgi:tRNA U34 5-carboxymethylaminomethyl modifying GTPase MnmE/TrmE